MSSLVCGLVSGLVGQCTNSGGGGATEGALGGMTTLRKCDEYV